MTQSKEPTTQVTLREILIGLDRSEEELENLDPAILVDTLHDKIDSIHLVLEKMKATAAHLKSLAKPFTEKARAIENSRERLREYVAFEMKTKGFPNLPGSSYKAILKTGHEKVVVETERQPTAQDLRDFQRFTRTEIKVLWDEDSIAKAFEAGEEIPSFIKVYRKNSTWVEFKPMVPEVLEKKGKKK